MNDDTLYYVQMWCKQSGLSIYAGGIKLSECWKTTDKAEAERVLETSLEEIRAAMEESGIDPKYDYDGIVHSISRKVLMKALLNGNAYVSVQEGVE